MKKEKAKRGKGRPAHMPTEEYRRLAHSFGEKGVTMEDAAFFLDISLNTFKKYYLGDFTKGRIFMDAQIKGNLHKIAMDINHPKCVTAGIFLAKVRFGWSENGNKKNDEDIDVRSSDYQAHAADMARKILAEEDDKKEWLATIAKEKAREREVEDDDDEQETDDVEG